VLDRLHFYKGILPAGQYFLVVAIEMKMVRAGWLAHGIYSFR